MYQQRGGATSSSSAARSSRSGSGFACSTWLASVIAGWLREPQGRHGRGHLVLAARGRDRPRDAVRLDRLDQCPDPGERPRIDVEPFVELARSAIGGLGTVLVEDRPGQRRDLACEPLAVHPDEGSQPLARSWGIPPRRARPARPRCASRPCRRACRRDRTGRRRESAGRRRRRRRELLTSFEGSGCVGAARRAGWTASALRSTAMHDSAIARPILTALGLEHATLSPIGQGLVSDAWLVEGGSPSRRSVLRVANDPDELAPTYRMEHALLGRLAAEGAAVPTPIVGDWNVDGWAGPPFSMTTWRPGRPLRPEDRDRAVAPLGRFIRTTPGSGGPRGRCPDGRRRRAPRRGRGARTALIDWAQRPLWPLGGARLADHAALRDRPDLVDRLEAHAARSAGRC